MSEPTANAPRGRQPHTQVPNLLADFVIPLLSGAEVSCLLYIVRRTYGFASADGERKTRDRISLSQFENGIQTGPYILDLGTGLTRNSVRGALKKLADKGLVRLDKHCSRCLWEPDQERPDAPAPGKECPRCLRTLDHSYGLVDLTPRILVGFLNANDPAGRSWQFDADLRRLRLADDQARAAPADATPLSEYIERLWYPDLAEQVIGQLSASRGGRRPADAQLIKHVYQPILELQGLSARRPAALRHALTETISRSIPSQARATGGKTASRRTNWGWAAYAKAVLARSLADPAFSGDRAAAPVDPAQKARDAEQGARDLLGRARELNATGELEAARAVLSELLGMTEALSTLLGGAERADAHLRCAFKKGVRDLASAPRAAALADYYPEWQWPDALPLT